MSNFDDPFDRVRDALLQLLELVRAESRSTKTSSPEATTAEVEVVHDDTADGLAPAATTADVKIQAPACSNTDQGMSALDLSLTATSGILPELAALTHATCSMDGHGHDAIGDGSMAVSLIPWDMMQSSTTSLEASPTPLCLSFVVLGPDKMAPTRCSTICFDDGIDLFGSVFRPYVTPGIMPHGPLLRPEPWPSFNDKRTYTARRGFVELTLSTAKVLDKEVVSYPTSPSFLTALQVSLSLSRPVREINVTRILSYMLQLVGNISSYTGSVNVTLLCTTSTFREQPVLIVGMRRHFPDCIGTTCKVEQIWCPVKDLESMQMSNCERSLEKSFNCLEYVQLQLWQLPRHTQGSVPSEKQSGFNFWPVQFRDAYAHEGWSGCCIIDTCIMRKIMGITSDAWKDFLFGVQLPTFRLPLMILDGVDVHASLIYFIDGIKYISENLLAVPLYWCVQLQWENTWPLPVQVLPTSEFISNMEITTRPVYTTWNLLKLIPLFPEQCIIGKVASKLAKTTGCNGTCQTLMDQHSGLGIILLGALVVWPHLTTSVVVDLEPMIVNGALGNCGLISSCWHFQRLDGFINYIKIPPIVLFGTQSIGEKIYNTISGFLLSSIELSRLLLHSYCPNEDWITYHIAGTIFTSKLTGLNIGSDASFIFEYMVVNFCFFLDITDQKSLFAALSALPWYFGHQANDSRKCLDSTAINAVVMVFARTSSVATTLQFCAMINSQVAAIHCGIGQFELQQTVHGRGSVLIEDALHCNLIVHILLMGSSCMANHLEVAEFFYSLLPRCAAYHELSTVAIVPYMDDKQQVKLQFYQVCAITFLHLHQMAPREVIAMCLLIDKFSEDSSMCVNCDDQGKIYWDPGGLGLQLPEMVFLIRLVMQWNTEGLNSVDAIEFPSGCEQAPFQGGRCIMVLAFLFHHYYLDASFNLAQLYFDKAISTTIRILRNIKCHGTWVVILRCRLGVKPNFKEGGLLATRPRLP